MGDGLLRFCRRGRLLDVFPGGGSLFGRGHKNHDFFLLPAALLPCRRFVYLLAMSASTLFSTSAGFISLSPKPGALPYLWGRYVSRSFPDVLGLA